MPESENTGKNVLCVSRYLATAGISGNCEYLGEVVQGLREQGHSVTYLWLDGPAFFRPWFRIPTQPLPYDKLILARGLRLGSFVFSSSLEIWLSGMLLVLCNRWNRMFPGLLGLTIRRTIERCEESLESGRHALQPETRPPSEQESSFVRRIIARYRPDILLLNYAYLAPLAVVGKQLGVQAAVLTHDVVHQLEKSMMDRGLTSECQAPTDEAMKLRNADLVVAIQDDERQTLQDLLGEIEVVTVPMPQRVRSSGTMQEPATLLFVGSGTRPNMDGLSWFLANVWPSARQKLPDLRLNVCGSVCGMVTEGPAGVNLKGRVDDLGAEYGRATLCIAPLNCGSGLKIKVVESWAHGRALVGTSTALQGLHEFDGRCAMKADDPDEFVRAIVRLVDDASYRWEMEREAIAVIEERFAPATALAPLTSWIASRH